MNKIEIQKIKTDILINLIKENPELEILPMVDTDCVCSDDFSYWAAKWGIAEVDEYWCNDGRERVYFKSNDFDDLVDEFIDNNYEDYPDLTDDELRKLAEEKVNSYEWIKTIAVYIGPL